jgi:death-on-curing protein
MRETIYLTIDDVLYIHDEQIRLYGGAAGVRDEGLILSALLRPQTGYYRDLIEEAAALWESLAINHGFVDGNKRVAFASPLIFLKANGHDLITTPDAAIALLDTWLRANTAPFNG